MPPCQGGWHVAGCYLESLGRASPPCTREKMPLTNLCSRLVVTSTQENRPVLELGALALLLPATLVEPRTRHACTERDTIRPRERKLAVAGITCLEWRVGLAPISPAVDPEASTSRDDRSPGHDSCGRYQPLHETRQQDHWRLTSPPARYPGCPEPAQEARALSTCGAPNTTASQARKRLPPLDPDGSTPRWRSERPTR
jgi:hypothetical protein